MPPRPSTEESRCGFWQPDWQTKLGCVTVSLPEPKPKPPPVAFGSPCQVRRAVHKFGLTASPCGTPWMTHAPPDPTMQDFPAASVTRSVHEPGAV